jgi:hypothetical protein
MNKVILFLCFLVFCSLSEAVGLSWTDNSDNELGFIMERADGSGESKGPFEAIAVTGPDVTVFIDATTVPMHVYTYRVCAYNDFGKSGYSNELIYNAPGLPPNAPELNPIESDPIFTPPIVSIRQSSLTFGLIVNNNNQSQHGP